MKYKSELLSELIEKNGHATTKVPHYESECENEFISEVRGAYPKLIDYSGEWLNYANNHVGIGKFPTERVENVTNARFENVVPYGYKSAILRGCTLVNLITNSSSNEIINVNKQSDGFIAKSLNVETKINYLMPTFELSTQYTLVFNSSHDFKLNIGYDSFSSNSWLSFNVKKGINKIILKSLSTNPYSNRNLLMRFVPTELIEVTELMLIKGDYTNIDIPYFEGMQSVRMPVLTTSNEDGTKTNILTVNEDVTLRSNGSVYDELDLLTGKLTQRIDEDGSVLTQEVVKTVDLNCLDENNNPTKFKPYEGVMYAVTSSETIPPLLDMEIPVEAINQNLAGFIN